MEPNNAKAQKAWSSINHSVLSALAYMHASISSPLFTLLKNEKVKSAFNPQRTILLVLQDPSI